MWCRQYRINFGDLAMDQVEPAQTMTKVGDLSELDYDVSGTVYIQDDTTLVIKDFTYNGKVC